jgi:hypothetical protein
MTNGRRTVEVAEAAVRGTEDFLRPLLAQELTDRSSTGSEPS